MKHVQRLFMSEWVETIKTVCVGVVAGIPLTYRPVDPFHVELGMVLEPLHCRGLIIIIRPKSNALQRYLQRPSQMEVTETGRIVQHRPVHGKQCALDIAGQMAMGILWMQHLLCEFTDVFSRWRYEGLRGFCNSSLHSWLISLGTRKQNGSLFTMLWCILLLNHEMLLLFTHAPILLNSSWTTTGVWCTQPRDRLWQTVCASSVVNGFNVNNAHNTWLVIVYSLMAFILFFCINDLPFFFHNMAFFTFRFLFQHRHYQQTSQ